MVVDGEGAGKTSTTRPPLCIGLTRPSASSAYAQYLGLATSILGRRYAADNVDSHHRPPAMLLLVDTPSSEICGMASPRSPLWSRSISGWPLLGHSWHVPLALRGIRLGTVAADDSPPISPLASYHSTCPRSCNKTLLSCPRSQTASVDNWRTSG